VYVGARVCLCLYMRTEREREREREWKPWKCSTLKGSFLRRLHPEKKVHMHLRNLNEEGGLPSPSLQVSLSLSLGAVT